jgi:hypothetical protein
MTGERFVHKPTVVTALQFNGANHELIKEFVGKKMVAHKRSDGKLYINTLEGMMLVNKDDYIVRGIQGEYYAVRYDIFIESYDEFKENENANTV